MRKSIKISVIRSENRRLRKRADSIVGIADSKHDFEGGDAVPTLKIVRQYYRTKFIII